MFKHFVILLVTTATIAQAQSTKPDSTILSSAGTNTATIVEANLTQLNSTIPSSAGNNNATKDEAESIERNSTIVSSAGNKNTTTTVEADLTQLNSSTIPNSAGNNNATIIEAESAELNSSTPRSSGNKPTTIVQANLAKLNSTNPSSSAGNNTRIVGGRPISINQAPWQVALIQDGNFACGGSIIRNDLVLTAAHCAVVVVLRTFLVRAGSSRWDRGGQTSRVRRILINSGYSNKTYDNDIALMRMRRSFTFNQSVRPIKLATEYQPPLRIAAVTGFGSTREGGPTSPILRGVILQFTTLKQCQKLYRSVNRRIVSTMVCAGEIGGGKDACQGDSGGPLFFKDILYGVVSFGEGCGRAKYPGIFTSVARQEGWIRRAVDAI